MVSPLSFFFFPSFYTFSFGFGLDSSTLGFIFYYYYYFFKDSWALASWAGRLDHKDG